MAPDLLAMADGVAQRLVEEALWSEGRALWLGDVKEEVAGNWEVVHQAVDGDVYGGTAGIGLFFARLWRVTGVSGHRSAAEGAFLHAAEWHRRSRPPGTLYSGSAGVAAALAEGAGTFGSDRLASLARDVALDALETLPSTATDLIGGRAGSIVALLAVARALDLPAALAAASRLGGELAHDAVTTAEGGAAWPSDIGSDEPPLCGLAHGQSGAALALDELAAVDRDPQMADLAGAAMTYERAWYDRVEENWPDLRELDRAGLTQGTRPAFPMFWCHGAVGIGLARLRRYELTRDTLAAVEAGAALQAAEKHLALHADVMVDDLSLCHGMAGLIELFLEGARVLGQPALLRLAAEGVGLVAAARGQKPGAWPCGVPEGGENPSLMLGLAGIGMMFLRAADPTVAPVGLLYTEPVVSQRVIVQLRGQATSEGLEKRSRELCDMVPGARVERFSRRGRVLLQVPDASATEGAIERFRGLADVEYAEADVIDRAQQP